MNKTPKTNNTNNIKTEKTAIKVNVSIPGNVEQPA